MRILWAACPEPGSLFPAVPVVRELLDRGHRITALADGAAAATFRSLGVDFRPAARRDAVGLAGLVDPDVDTRRVWHSDYVHAWFADGSDELRRQFYDLVMVDPLEPGADFAAEAAGVPSFSYTHWAMNETGPDVFFVAKLWSGVGEPVDEFVEFWNAQRATVGLGPETRPRSQHRWYRQSRRLSLVLGLPQIVHPRGALPAYARRVGPTVWEPPAGPELPGPLAVADRRRPLVLASVSTLGKADVGGVRAIAHSVRDQDVDLVLTLPNEEAPGDLPPNVTAVPFLPHSAEVLARVDLVISHAGYGTVTRAACAGRPMLLLPRKGDQFFAARGAAHAGIAIRLDPDDVTADAVQAAVRDLLADPAYHRRAAAIAQAARRYDAARDAADSVEQLAATAS